MQSISITPSHEYWPVQLADLDETPERLWAIGNLSLLTNPMIAIVGSRASTSYGNQMAGEITAGLVRQFVIVSGGAFGIDEAAHRAALFHHGQTVVVQPGGLDHLHPAAHRELFDRIVDADGLIISEYPPATPPSRTRFLARNRIIAALAVGMIVVEATRISGARAAANWAEKTHRSLMAVPGPVTSAQSAGCHEMIRRGARLVRDADDVLDVLDGRRYVTPSLERT